MNEEMKGYERVRDFVSEIVRRCGLELSVDADENGEAIEIRLSGEDSELVLQSNARLLEALNDLANQIFHRRVGRRIEVDCNDFRLSRSIELELLARNAAEKARLTGRAFRFQPMPAGERRTIHLTLAETAGIRTESHGTGKDRHVVVLPD